MERQQLLKEFNIRAFFLFGERVNPRLSVWGVSEVVRGRGL